MNIKRKFIMYEAEKGSCLANCIEDLAKETVNAKTDCVMQFNGETYFARYESIIKTIICKQETTA